MNKTIVRLAIAILALALIPLAAASAATIDPSKVSCKGIDQAVQDATTATSKAVGPTKKQLSDLLKRLQARQAQCLTAPPATSTATTRPAASATTVATTAPPATAPATTVATAAYTATRNGKIEAVTVVNHPRPGYVTVQFNDGVQIIVPDTVPTTTAPPTTLAPPRKVTGTLVSKSELLATVSFEGHQATGLIDTTGLPDGIIAVILQDGTEVVVKDTPPSTTTTLPPTTVGVGNVASTPTTKPAVAAKANGPSRKRHHRPAKVTAARRPVKVVTTTKPVTVDMS